MNHSLKIVSVALLGSAFVIGCNSPEKAQQSADEARQQAQDKSLEAQREADKAKAQAQADAIQKQNQADQTLATARNDYHARVSSLIVDLDKRTADLQAASLTATPADKKRNDDRIATLAVFRRTLEADLHDVDGVMAADWETTRARVDRDMSDARSAMAPFSNKT